MQGFAELVAEVLDVTPGEVVDEAGPASLETWTSLRHVQLVVTLEEVYGVSFTRDEIFSFTTVGRIREAVRAKSAVRS